MKSDNELIAEFMGVMVFQTYADMQAHPLDTLTHWLLPEQMIYHKSWNELMPVVEKMFSLWEGTGKDGFQKSLNLRLHSFTRRCPIHSPIQQVHQRTIEFIKWYNENKK